MKQTIAHIDTELAQLREKLEAVQGRPTEVYSRIVGYYRSLRNWNIGKREEFRHRITFLPGQAQSTAETSNEASTVSGTLVSPAADYPSQATHAPARFEYFFRAACPNCPPVRKRLGSLHFGGDHIDTDTSEGFLRAQEAGVYSTPTVILYDAGGAELSRVRDVRTLEAQLEERAVRV